MGYIYKIYNDIDNKIYIGQTIQSIEARWSQHQYKARNFTEGKLFEAINIYGIDHFYIEQVEECDNSQLNEKEIYWINYYNSYENGYNMTRGGGQYREEEENQLLLSIYDLWDKGYSIIEIAEELHSTRTIVRDRIYGYKNYSEEEAIKRGIKKAKEAKYKKVYQWDKNGNFINEYNSLKEASEKTNTSYKALSQAINKEGSSNGYFWTLTKEKPKNISIQNTKRVAQYDLQNNLIKIYNSRKEAAEATGADASSIGKCCKGNVKTVKGYIWKNYI